MIDKTRLRTLLRIGGESFITPALVGKTLGLKADEINVRLQELENLGYIEKITIEGYWGISVVGKVFASQSFNKLYKVESLHKHLKGFYERLVIVNSSDKFAHLVDKVKITSQYPITDRSHGISILYSLKRKEISRKKYDSICRELAKKSKKRFYNYVAWLFYPEVAIHETLKGRSHILKLRKAEEDSEVENINGHLLYDFATDQESNNR
jgi:hypothetical protein